MGKSMISMAIFNSFLYVYQRVLVDLLSCPDSVDLQSPVLRG